MVGKLESVQAIGDSFFGFNIVKSNQKQFEKQLQFSILNELAIVAIFYLDSG